MHKEIGEKINELRSANGMTLKELGDKANLSVSFLSQAERGLTSITINTLKKIAQAFEVDHSYGMYIDEQWYELIAREGSFNSSDPVDRLDVSILQNNLLQPILGINDPRTEKRIDFIGGIRGLDELERRVKAGMRLAFSMYPTTIEDLMSIADAGEVMPPKSTWFEPKLRSGLFIHELS
jgi:uncharacterized protein (DUF1015 family)